MRRLVLGGPGCGKTERLMGVVEGAIARGVAPDRIAFSSFTRRAAAEARDRAAERFGFSADDAPHFRTLHSIAYRGLGLSPGAVMSRADWDELTELTGAPHGRGASIEDGAAGTGVPLGDRMTAIDSYARAREVSLEDAWAEHGEPVRWREFQQWKGTFELYKRDAGKWDFSDMIEMFPESCAPLDVDVAIVDEAQDLTRAQWRMVDYAFAKVSETWIAGDDDQAIYRWAGADTERFMALDAEREVLPESHRLPETVFNESQRVIAQVARRYEKRFASTGRSGTVEWVAPDAKVDLSEGTWLLLARNRSALPWYEALAREQGAIYEGSVDPVHVAAIRAWERLRRGGLVEGTAANAALGRQAVADEGMYSAADLKLGDMPIWHDALEHIPIGDREYYLIALRRGEDLERPRVRISTVHGAKGAEAENVLLRLDMSPRTHRSYERDPDAEHRVFYVGMTRARKRLLLMESWGRRAYRVPL